jgi:hypothetical protein
MINVPDQLVARLTPNDARQLRALLSVLGEELSAIYTANVRDHRPRDNANVFGIRVWVHLWSVLRERLEDLGGATLVEINNTFCLRVGPLTIGIHKLGHVANEDIHGAFPDGSPTQRAYGERNAGQLTLFEREQTPAPDDRAYALCDLIVGHFGNPEEGLVKWYLGAHTYVDGIQTWAWVEPQPVVDAKVLPDVTPYSQRPVEPVDIKPRRRSDEEVAREGSAGA